MSNFFDKIVKSVKDEDLYKVSDGGFAAEISGYVDTGSYWLNAQISGSIRKGLPDNKVVGIAGDEATGKTFLALAIVKNFLDMYPDAAVFYFDTESSVTKEIMSSRGIDISRVYIRDTTTVEKFRTKALQILEEYEKTPKEERPRMMFVLDSLGNMSSNKEVEDMGTGKDVRDMTRTQLIKGAFRVLTVKLGKLSVPMIVTNHTYTVIGGFNPGKAPPPKEQGGGSGLKYAASIILFLSKKVERDTPEKGKTYGKVIGNTVTVTTRKSRLTVEGLKGQAVITFAKGLDRYHGMFDMAVSCGVFERVGNKYKTPATGDDLHWEKDLRPMIKADPERFYTPDVLDKIDSYLGPQYQYGVNQPIPSEEDSEDDDDE